MSVLQLNSTPSSSAVTKPVLEGSLSWIPYTENLISSFFEVVSNKIDEFVEQLSKDLYQLLSSDPAWSPYAKSVTLVFEQGELIANINNEYAISLEYGSPEVPINSKVRPFVLESISNLKEHIDTELKKVYGE
jgi:hypothetical protein